MPVLVFTRTNWSDRHIYKSESVGSHGMKGNALEYKPKCVHLRDQGRVRRRQLHFGCYAGGLARGYTLSNRLEVGERASDKEAFIQSARKQDLRLRFFRRRATT